LKQKRFIRKERKMGKKGHQIFYLSKEYYQQWFYMEPLMIVHQQQFTGITVVDSGISTAVSRRTAADT
jgi:hypothetical protein